MSALWRMLMRALIDTGMAAATRTDPSMTAGERAGKRRLRQTLQRLRKAMRFWR